MTATAALSLWKDDHLERAVFAKQAIIEKRLAHIGTIAGAEATVRGRGMIQGIEFADSALAAQVSAACFERGLIVETAGIDDQVLKLLPSLTIEESELKLGLDIIEDSVRALVKAEPRELRSAA